MINHFMKVFNAKDIGLLKLPHEGIKELGKKNHDKISDNELFLMEVPYILTNNLCDEIMNLEYRQSGNETKVEQISRKIPKDKFSALMYGLYWIYLEEMDSHIKQSDYEFLCLYN